MILSDEKKKYRHEAIYNDFFWREEKNGKKREPSNRNMEACMNGINCV